MLSLNASVNRKKRSRSILLPGFDKLYNNTQIAFTQREPAKHIASRHQRSISSVLRPGAFWKNRTTSTLGVDFPSFVVKQSSKLSLTMQEGLMRKKKKLEDQLDSNPAERVSDLDYWSSAHTDGNNIFYYKLISY